ncbi:MAG: hypothetical protein KDN18_11540 [Verrucomicrobiae bacterium]|nr:hypothetical protein [Verrucomicrobiae bacterium]
MKPRCLPLFGASLLISSLHPVFAGDPATLLAERGKLLVSEDFSSAVEPARVEPGKPWTVGWRLRPGKWEFNDGVMKGTEVAADKHGAVARFPLKFQDVVIQYEVRLDGCRQTTLSINDQKEHVCRVLVSPSGFTAQKDDHDHEGPDKAEVFGKAAVPVGKGEWKTVVLEIVGEEMVAHIDDQVIAGSHELIGTAKANFGFTVAGDGASFRNLRVWEATPNPAWSKTKAGLAKP